VIFRFNSSNRTRLHKVSPLLLQGETYPQLLLPLGIKTNRLLIWQILTYCSHILLVILNLVDSKTVCSSGKARRRNCFLRNFPSALLTLKNVTITISYVSYKNGLACFKNFSIPSRLLFLGGGFSKFSI
jgi:hypothetical protein